MFGLVLLSVLVSCCDSVWVRVFARFMASYIVRYVLASCWLVVDSCLFFFCLTGVWLVCWLVGCFC